MTCTRVGSPIFMNKFSLIMSVYKNDDADNFLAALESVTTKQTLKPSQAISFGLECCFGKLQV